MMRRPLKITTKLGDTIILYYAENMVDQEINELSVMLEIAPDMLELVKRLNDPNLIVEGGIHNMVARILNKVRGRIDI